MASREVMLLEHFCLFSSLFSPRSSLPLACGSSLPLFVLLLRGERSSREELAPRAARREEQKARAREKEKNKRKKVGFFSSAIGSSVFFPFPSSASSFHFFAMSDGKYFTTTKKGKKTRGFFCWLRGRADRSEQRSGRVKRRKKKGLPSSSFDVHRSIERKKLDGSLRLLRLFPSRLFLGNARVLARQRRGLHALCVH
jgi:hypothetical protein